MPLMEVEAGIKIHYEEWGEGDRYLLCTQVDHSRFSLERELAKRGFHVFLLTNRGFGQSTHVREDYGEHWYDRFADDVIAFADKLGIDKFAYSGASHGAGTGWHVVLRHPERVICFFAVVPGPHNLDEGKQSIRSLTMSGKLKLPVMRTESADPRIRERYAIEAEENRAKRAQPDYEAIYDAPETKAIDFGRPLAALHTEANVLETLKTIKTPVLIIGGMEDPISRPDLMIRTAKCLPNCKLIIHSGVSHVIPIVEDMADDALRFYENAVNTGWYYSPIVND